MIKYSSTSYIYIHVYIHAQNHYVNSPVYMFFQSNTNHNLEAKL